MTTADSHIGSNRQHRLSDQVPANTHNTRARRKGARDSGPSAAASISPPAPGVSGEHLILYGSGLPGLGLISVFNRSSARGCIPRPEEVTVWHVWRGRAATGFVRIGYTHVVKSLRNQLDGQPPPPQPGCH